MKIMLTVVSVMGGYQLEVRNEKGELIHPLAQAVATTPKTAGRRASELIECALQDEAFAEEAFADEAQP